MDKVLNKPAMMRRLLPGLIVSLFIFTAGCENKDEIASVNGRGISQQEFDAYLQHKRIAVRDDAHKDKLLDQYLRREALADVVEDMESQDRDLIKAELNELRKEVLISRYFEHYLHENVSDQVVSNYYNNNVAEYEERKAHIAHILVRTNNSMDEVQRKSKLTTAQEAHSKIRGGMDFAEAAERYSEDAVSAKKGGDLGWIKEGTIDKAFSDKAFGLKVGEVSEPFESAFGFHLVTVIEEPKTVRRPLDSVAGQIRHQLRTQYKDAEMERLVGKMKIEKK